VYNCDYRLRSVIGKFKKKHIDDSGRQINVTWKYKIFYTVLNRFDAMCFESKYISQYNIETSECSWVAYDMIKNRKIQMSEKVYSSVTQIMDMVLQNYNEELLLTKHK
jgi:hypothetical protein